jgi:hypothetical protein
MRNGFLGSIAVLLAGAGLTLAEPLPPTQPDPTPALKPAAAPEPLPKTPPDPGPAASPKAPVPAAPPPGVEEAVPEETPAACPAEEEEPPGKCLFWVSGEYLLWKLKNAPLPVPIVTTGPPGTLGALTDAGVSVLSGGTDINLGGFSGTRWTAGFTGPGGLLSLEAGGFVLERHSKDFAASSDANGFPVLGRPVINAQTGTETSFVVAAPGAFSGAVATSATSRLWSPEVNFSGCMFRSCCFNADMLLGARYVNLEESFDVSQTSTLLAGGIAAFDGVPLSAGQTLTINDHFGTQNQFYGGQIGAQAELRYQRFFVYALGKVALGANHETVSVAGGTALNGVGQPIAVAPGGLLAVSSNSGLVSRDEFAVVPEVGVNVGYRVTKSLIASVGFTFLYWSDVVRPGDQINRVVSPALVPASQSFGSGVGPAQPVLPFHHSDFWAYGLTAGLAFRY